MVSHRMTGDGVGQMFVSLKSTMYWFEGYSNEGGEFYVAPHESVLMYEDQFGEYFYQVYDSILGEYVAYMVM